MRILLIVLLFLVSCQKSEIFREDQTLRINIGVDPQTLDPRKARDLTSITLVHMLFEGLTRASLSGETELAIAEKIETDGLQYRFTLRKSFWSNGDPLTSFDFAESWRNILDPEFPTDNAYQLYGIKNAKKAKLGELSLSEVGISTPDAQTLIVELEYPIPYFLELISMPPFFPTHQDAFNGPFKLVQWKHADLIETEKNPNYWQSSDVKLSKIELFMMGNDTEMQMCQEGKLHWAGSPLSTIHADAIQSLKAEGKLSVSPFLATCFFRVNTAKTAQGKKNPLNSPSLRRALASALDRKAITEHILQGGHLPAYALTPPAMGLESHRYFEETSTKLSESLEEPICISYASSERNAAIAQAVQKQWEKHLGIKVELEAVEPKTYFQRISNKEYQLAIGSWTADFNDPINFLEVFKYNSATTNNTNWENREYIDLLERSAFCLDENERKEVLRKAETILMEEMPIIPIFHFALNHLHADGLEEVALSPLGKIDFRWAHFKTR